MTAEAATMPLRKRAAETAMDLRKSSDRNNGENLKSPPKPIMVWTREEKKMTISNKGKAISVDPFSLNIPFD